MARGSHFEEVEEGDVEAFAANGEQPEDGGERAGDGEVGAEVDGDEDDVAEQALRVREGEGVGGDKAERKVVDEVVGNGDGEADGECGDGCSEMLRGEKSALGEGECADALDGFDEDEERGDEGDGAPTDLFEEWARDWSGCG